MFTECRFDGVIETMELENRACAAERPATVDDMLFQEKAWYMVRSTLLTPTNEKSTRQHSIQ